MLFRSGIREVLETDRGESPIGSERLDGVSQIRDDGPRDPEHLAHRDPDRPSQQRIRAGSVEHHGIATQCRHRPEDPAHVVHRGDPGEGDDRARCRRQAVEQRFDRGLPVETSADGEAAGVEAVAARASTRRRNRLEGVL